MCWRSRIKPVINVANKDIEVYKILFSSDGNDVGISLITKYTYLKEEVNKMKNGNSLPVSFDIDETYNIDEGFHSYDGKCKFLFGKNFFEQEIFCLYDIACTEKTIYKEKLITVPKSCVIGLFIIPSGSHYYENEDGEIVSDSIILKEMINIEDIGESEQLRELNDIKFKRYELAK